ncbi:MULTISPECIES: Na+/H+ antiporter NhaC family protein [Rhodopirellula]|uniref:Na+/H+ antiporter NhaC family protein n=1 Tax=Rhodopirellula TaxID=265488 RepID=UPI00257AD0D2|nr:Na+/H+ antiporter NhaC family protein [Rhodopirellula sp. UBA1907]|tara:strand:- start:14496 stop:16124 length:1629 start_codon:yes stop_codon:yes gene_type:complete
MTDGIESLLPPAVAIILALITRRVLLPLAIGIFVGTWLLASKEDGGAAYTLAQSSKHFFLTIYQSVRDWDHLHVLAFTLLLGGMVGVLESAGSMARMISGWTRRVSTRRGGQTLIGFTGLLIFFDDYANTLLVGGTMRTTAERYGISRAKLAYLVDSTAAPVAGLTLVSTWVATELSYLQTGLTDAGIDATNMTFSVFLHSLPYRFYPLLALWFVFVIARSGKDFGPMWEEENAASRKPIHPSRWTSSTSWRDTVAAVMPIVICLIVISGVLIWTGLQTPVEGDMSTWQTFGHVIGNGNSYLALVAGGAAGLVVAGALAMLLSKVSWELVAMGTMEGMFQMLPAMAVLWLAWGLSSLTGADQLNTGGYLASILDTRLPVEWLPTCVFLLAAFIAFSTGTSWGTMAILTPLSVALSINLQQAALAASDTAVLVGLQSTATASLAMSPICLATFSSVLAGAIFGDHCSPLSDTTVLSSRACDCDHVLHVRTQMPYALVVGVTCILFGTLPASWGISPWISLLISTAVLWLIVRVLGKPPQTAAP